MITTTRELRELLDPWPIAMTKGRYRWTVSTAAKCSKLKCFWNTPAGKKISVAAAAKKVRKYWPDHHHHVSALIRSGPGLTFVIVEDGVVVDGNHRLIAMIQMKYRTPVIRVDLVRGSAKGDENVPALRKRWQKKNRSKWGR